MKWFILIMALRSDFLLLPVLGYAFYMLPFKVAAVLVILTLWVWRKQGGFSNWRPSNIKRFLRNWDKVKG